MKTAKTATPLNRRHCLQGLGAAALLAAVGARAADGGATTVRQFSGKATDQATGQWLYTEQHRQVYAGERWVSGQIRYVSPQGALMAEKTLDFSRDRFVPLTRMTQPDVGVEEAITQVGQDTVTMETVRDGQRKSDEVKRAPVMAADSGFHSFVQAHLEALLAGQTVTLAFGVVSQRSSYKFRVRKADKPASGDNRVALVAEPDSLLRLLADPLQLVYDTQTRDLLEYNGLSNLVDAQTRKTPKVRIVYTYPRP